ncbi:MAG: SulP family inorganic anion transporter [Acidimicrobiales bacterium]
MRSLPVLTTLRGYQRSWLVPDLVAGLTLVAIAIPEQMATARLAGVPAITGLYAFLAGSVMFALLGANRTMSIGADSTIAPIFAAGVATVAVTGTPRYLHLVTFLAIIIGALVAAVGLLRLGWVANFLPAPVVHLHPAHFHVLVTSPPRAPVSWPGSPLPSGSASSRRSWGSPGVARRRLADCGLSSTTAEACMAGPWGSPRPSSP